MRKFHLYFTFTILRTVYIAKNINHHRYGVGISNRPFDNNIIYFSKKATDSSGTKKKKPIACDRIEKPHLEMYRKSCKMFLDDVTTLNIRDDLGK